MRCLQGVYLESDRRRLCSAVSAQCSTVRLISQLICWGFFVFIRYIFPFGPKRSVAFYSDDRAERIRLRNLQKKLHGSLLRRRPSHEDVQRTRDSLNRSFPGLDVAGKEIEESCYEDNEGKIVIENPRVSRRFWSSDIGDVSVETLGKYESLRKAVEEPLATRLTSEDIGESESASSTELVGRTVDSFDSISAFESETESASSTNSDSQTKSETEVTSTTSHDKTEPDAFMDLILSLCPDLDELSIDSFREVEKGNYEDLDVIECFVYFADVGKAAQDDDIHLIREFYTKILLKANPSIISKCLHLVNQFSFKIDFSEVVFAVFDRFSLTEEDEKVRWNLLNHLADIAQTVMDDPENLYQLIARIGTFPPPANPYNWRYLELYLHQCAEIVMMPIAIDQLVQLFGIPELRLRWMKVEVPCSTYRPRFGTNRCPGGGSEDKSIGETSREFNERLLSTFAHQKKNWRRRQVYAYIIEYTCAENLLSELQFYAFFATPFFHYIIEDPIPNIRLQFSRALLRTDPKQFCNFGLSIYAKFILERTSRVDESETVRRMASEALEHLGGFVPEEDEQTEEEAVSEDVTTAIESEELVGETSGDSGVQTAEEISE